MSHPTFTLHRERQTPYATYGRLRRADGTEVCVTIERPWVDLDADGKRDRGVSRFVPGTYECFRRKVGTGHRTYDVFELLAVPDATNIQIHIANLPTDLEGCVGLGTAFGQVQKHPSDPPMPGVIGSTAAHGRWLTENAGCDTLTLVVLDEFAP